MTRKEKITILHAISEGKISTEDLQPPRVYIFMERLETPGAYQHNGKDYNEIEYREFCEKVERKRNNPRMWDNGKGFPNEDVIITIRHGPSDTADGQKLSLNV